MNITAFEIVHLVNMLRNIEQCKIFVILIRVSYLRKVILGLQKDRSKNRTGVKLSQLVFLTVNYVKKICNKLDRYKGIRQVLNEAVAHLLNAYIRKLTRI